MGDRDANVSGKAWQAGAAIPGEPARLDVVEGERRPGVGDGATGGGEGVGDGGAARPYLQVFFRCANQYMRVYRSVDGSGYLARCPKCAKCMNFRVGPGGSSRRFFEVGC